MKQLVLRIKDEKKSGFLIELLEQFDFIEIEEEQKRDENYDFFASAGLWKNRNIDGQTLRNEAWKRNH